MLRYFLSKVDLEAKLFLQKIENRFDDRARLMAGWNDGPEVVN